MLRTENHLRQRIIVGSSFALFIFFAIYFSLDVWFRPIFSGIVSLAITLALYEFYAIAKHKGFLPLSKIGIGGSFLYGLSLFFAGEYPSLSSLPESLLLITLFLSFCYYFFKGEDPLVNLSITLFGFLYLTIPLGCLLSINYFFEGTIEDGRIWLLYLIFVTKMTDIGAFFTGKKWGKTKLTPYISPKKTVEGAIGGFLCATFTGLMFYLSSLYVFNEGAFQITLFESIWVSAVIGIMAQFGDLAESLLKRDGGIKDSNRLPGLGGILDTLDSLVFTSPFLYIFLKN